jgi:hypothetical protein
LNVPKGPTIPTVLLASLAKDLLFLLATGCNTLNVTSGGIESGARPIYDCRGAEEQNDREESGKAGRRKDGRDVVGVETITLSRPFERAVESIAMLTGNSVLESVVQNSRIGRRLVARDHMEWCNFDV